MTYVTSDPGLREDVESDAQARNQRRPDFFAIVEANRWQKLRLVRSLLQLAVIIVRVRPHVVITTGAAPGYMAVRLAGLCDSRTVWVDSIANGEELSLSGRKAGRHVDLWLTQWEDLARSGGPHYRGSIL